MAFEDIKKGSAEERAEALSALATQGTKGVDAYRRSKAEIATRDSAALSAIASDTAAGTATRGEASNYQTLVGSPAARAQDRLSSQQGVFEADLARQSGALGSYLDRLVGAIDVHDAELQADIALDKARAGSGGSVSAGGSTKLQDSGAISIATKEGQQAGDRFRQADITANEWARKHSEFVTDERDMLLQQQAERDRTRIQRDVNADALALSDMAGLGGFAPTAPRSVPSVSGTTGPASRRIADRQHVPPDSSRLARYRTTPPSSGGYSGLIDRITGAPQAIPTDPRISAVNAGLYEGLQTVVPEVQQQRLDYASLLSPSRGRNYTEDVANSIDEAISLGRLPENFRSHPGTPDYLYQLLAAEQELGFDPYYADALFNQQADDDRAYNEYQAFHARNQAEADLGDFYYEQQFVEDDRAIAEQKRRNDLASGQLTADNFAAREQFGFVPPDDPQGQANLADLAAEQAFAEAVDQANVAAAPYSDNPGRLITPEAVNQAAGESNVSPEFVLDVVSHWRFQEAVNYFEDQLSVLPPTEASMLIVMGDLGNPEHDYGRLVAPLFAEFPQSPSVLESWVSSLYGGRPSNEDRREFARYGELLG